MSHSTQQALRWWWSERQRQIPCRTHFLWFLKLSSASASCPNLWYFCCHWSSHSGGLGKWLYLIRVLAGHAHVETLVCPLSFRPSLTLIPWPRRSRIMRLLYRPSATGNSLDAILIYSWQGKRVFGLKRIKEHFHFSWRQIYIWVGLAGAPC